MAPFSIHATRLEGIKDRTESLCIQGDRLYLGTAGGDLNIYGLNRDAENPNVLLVETKKGFCRKSIDQIGFIKDTNSLIVLSDGVITLFGLPDLSTGTPLPQARNVLSFAVHTTVLHILPDGKYVYDEPGDSSQGIPSVVTRLIVGCRKKVVVFTWRDGEFHETKELNLPHSPRAVVFLKPDTACLSYTQADHVMLSLEAMTVSEIILPSTSTVTVAGISKGALSGLGGYMTLGFGGKEKKPCVVGVDNGEVLLPKDNTGVFVGPDGKPTRTLGLDWRATPEENVYVKPYLISILPPGSTPAKLPGQSHLTHASHSAYLQIYSTISLLPVQILTPPFSENIDDVHQKPYIIRLLSATFPDKSPLFFVMTPLDRTAATTEGSALWMLSMHPWGDQIDELVNAGLYSEALALLDTVEEVFLPDKEERRKSIRILQAVFLFSEGQFDEAINTFIDLDINPTKVVALYPESVAGRLSTPKEKWFQLHGGHPPAGFIRTDTDSTRPIQEDVTIAVVQDNEQDASRSYQSGLRGKWMVGLDRLVPGGGQKEDDTASISSKTKEKPIVNDFRRSVETLYRYLGDRRPKLSRALSNFRITPAQATDHPLLSATSVEDLFSMPNGPLSSLVPDQLVCYAQVVDTAFFKSYLEIRPSLLASLCRIPNWCEVDEVEEVLRSRQKFTELIFLYQGKHMHGKALGLLRQMSESVDDQEEKLRPTINYLQKLSAQYLPQIFDASRWVLDIDSDMGFEIFTSEEHDLPKEEVTNFLEAYNPHISVRYLEFLVQERNDTSTTSHEHLAEGYLNLFMNAKKQGDSELQRDMYSRLLKFMSESSHYQVDRLFARLPSDDMFEARAVLLGKLGKHEGALEIYVYRLQDYLKAEDYCKKTYQIDPESKGIFLALLRIYLHSNAPHLLKPALELISRHSPRLDAVETLNLLPPMVSAEDLNAFLHGALRTPLFDTRVICEMWKGRLDQVSLSLAGLQSKRVKITDSRICPQCHKRIGNSVIAVHAPKGEVTHYTCREPFSRKLKEA